jgi:hypothetical protein
MEKVNLKLTNTTKHESLEQAAQILRNVIKLYVSDRFKD